MTMKFLSSLLAKKRKLLTISYLFKSGMTVSGKEMHAQKINVLKIISLLVKITEKLGAIFTVFKGKFSGEFLYFTKLNLILLSRLFQYI
jgi:hypothetical protein